MELNKKKKIAREFLFFLSCVLISGIAFVGTYSYNYVVKSKVGKLEKKIILLKDSISELEKPIDTKLSKQKWFYKENLKRDVVYGSYSKLWERLEYLHKSDSIVFKWNNVWNVELKKMVKEVGFENVQEFDKFIKDNSLNLEELEIKAKTDFLQTQIVEFENQIKLQKHKIMDITKQFNFALLILAIIGIVVFPIRCIYYAVKWSIKTLKE